MTGTTIHINAQLLSLAAGAVVPLLVSLLSKLHADRGLMAVLNGLLSALTGALATAIAASGSVIWQTYAFNIAVAWIASVSTYYGVLKPTGLAPAIQGATGRFGIGSGTAPPTATAASTPAGVTVTPAPDPVAVTVETVMAAPNPLLPRPSDEALFAPVVEEVFRQAPTPPAEAPRVAVNPEWIAAWRDGLSISETTWTRNPILRKKAP